jgi:hypothetical protein
MIQLDELNHDSWTVGDSGVEAFLPGKIRVVTAEVCVHKMKMM